MHLAGDVIEPEHLEILPPATTSTSTPVETSPSSPTAATIPPPAPPAPADDEKARIIDALTRANGNQKEAARLLGVSRRQLTYRLDTYGLPRPRKR
jgi:transcriptional regulator with GAF, ATPase, and Fis domain